MTIEQINAELLKNYEEREYHRQMQEQHKHKEAEAHNKLIQLTQKREELRSTGEVNKD